MSHLIFAASADPATEVLRRRIFNAVPAATFQMQKLFELLDIGLSAEIPTAAISSGTQPRMIFNPAFVADSCRTDEHLLMLVLHELYHLILGHTRIFPRMTPVMNLAFDTVINSMLCRQFPQSIYTSFFMAANAWDKFPSRLLRPPPGWPAMDAVRSLPEAEQPLFEMLYGKEGMSLTYFDVFALLRKQLPRRRCGHYLLLGDHNGRNGASRDEDRALRDVLLTQAIRRMVEGWPPPPFRISGRDTGKSPFCKALPVADQPGARFSRELVRLLRRAGVGAMPRSVAKRREWQTQVTATTSVFPQANDRRARTFQSVYGHDPVFYQADTRQRRLALTPRTLPHVYIDISGSMNAATPYLVSALTVPHRRGECRCFVFSTVVDEIRPRQLSTQKVRNTGGTAINCVTRHLLEIPASHRPRRVLILTDGYVGPMDVQHAAALKTGHVRLYVGLVNSPFRGDLESHAHWIGTLPPVDT
jgi:hypothetical protein